MLIEGRVDDLRRQYPDIDVDGLARQDPSQNNKYLAWMAKQLSRGAPIEDLVPSVVYFHRYHTRFQKKDLYAYKTVDELEDAVKDIGLAISAKTHEKAEVTGADVMYEDDEYVLVYVGDKKTCMSLGSGTKWCITMRDATYYDDYVGRNVVFYFMLRKHRKNDANDKIAIAVQRDQSNRLSKITPYDAQDHPMQLRSMKSAIMKVVKRDAAIRPKGELAKLNAGELSNDEIRDALVKRSGDWDDLAGALKLLPNNVRVRDLFPDGTDIFDAGLQAQEFGKRMDAYTYAPLSDEEILHALKTDTRHPRVMVGAIARNRSTPPHILAQLAQDDDDWMRAWPAENPSTPHDTLIALTSDHNISVVSSVAKNSAISADIAKALLARPDKKADRYIRWNMTVNNHTPGFALDILSYEEKKDGRRMVAKNANAAEATLARLSGDEDKKTRINVSENPSTPEFVLRKMANDASPKIRRTIKARLSEHTVRHLIHQLVNE